jgi:hypothetical protein
MLRGTTKGNVGMASACGQSLSEGSCNHEMVDNKRADSGNAWKVKKLKKWPGVNCFFAMELCALKYLRFVPRSDNAILDRPTP